jgi:hypothetical protein
VKAKKHEENRRCADVTPNVRAEKKGTVLPLEQCKLAGLRERMYRKMKTR